VIVKRGKWQRNVEDREIGWSDMGEVPRKGLKAEWAW